MRPGVILAVCAGAALVIATYAVISPSSLPRLMSLQEEEDQLENDVASTKEKNARLSNEVRVLQGGEPESAAVLEKAAREELGWVKRDEVVVTLPAVAPAPPVSAPSSDKSP